MTAQDAAVFMVAFIGPEMSEMLTEVGKLQSEGKGSPHQHSGLGGPPEPPSISSDLSVVTERSSQPREGHLPSREQTQRCAPICAAAESGPGAGMLFFPLPQNPRERSTAPHCVALGQ